MQPERLYLQHRMQLQPAEHIISKEPPATGCSDIKPVVVTINPKPTVAITNPAAVCAPGNC